MDTIETVAWAPDGESVRIIDQTRLPAEYVERDLRTVSDVVDAIRQLAVRGAPAIGICGAMGLVASMRGHARDEPSDFRARLEANARLIRDSRPTAVNLAWAIDRMMRVAANAGADNAALTDALRDEATTILA